VTFTGWPAEALEFYEGLEADNSKTYWTEHKTLYEEQVRAPMLALLAELEPEFGPGRIFRPYRDVRFSADKSPYKTTCAATLDRGGYIQLSAAGLATGAGMYMMSPAQLRRFRDAVADPTSGAALERAIAVKGASITGHDKLKTVPRGYDKEHPRVELLKLKGLIAWREWDAEPWLGTKQAKTKVAAFLRACAPLTDWLGRYVGPDNAE
jgi:uncharacterized protein (TIGR02453 family)